MSKFDNFIKNSTAANLSLTNLDPNTISLYPVSDYNLEGIKILVANCMRMGSGQSSNVAVATIDPSLWLGNILDKHWDKISFISTGPQFEVLKINGDQIVSKNYRVDIETIIDDENLDKFFEDKKWKRLVIFSIVKLADLMTMKTYYSVRYSDITEKYEERDIKIDSILDNPK